MPEINDDKRIFSLLEVTSSIQKTISLRYSTSFWVKAEMNKLNSYPHSGHCYPDLVDKVEGKIIAQMKSTLWRDDFLRINRTFLDVVKTPLKDGIRILFCARITFDQVHGLSLRILDIDPVFSLGELEREKQESILLLKQENVFDQNKTVPFPLLPKRLAVISVQTSKGYADFLKVLGDNAWGYRFFHLLFPSLLQGDRAVDSIRYQLRRIRKVAHHFDVVAIIRGGGGEVGLTCFNDVNLSRDIALFPIPVITGIGHATNETVAEMVAYRNAITPTELADFLLQKFHNFSMPVQRAEEILTERSGRILKEERERLQHAVKYFRSVTGHIILRRHHELANQSKDLFKLSNLRLLHQRQEHVAFVHKIRSYTLSFCSNVRQIIGQHASGLRKGSASYLKAQGNELSNLTKAVSNMHPENVLKRGYSITRLNGKTVTRSTQVKASDILQTILADGSLLSEVKSTKKSQDL